MAQTTATKSTASKKSTASTSTGSRSAASRSTTSKTTNSKTTKPTPRLHEREPKVLAEQASYAAAALYAEAVDFAQSLPTRLTELRGQAPARVVQLREQAPSRVQELREQLEASVGDLRSRATKQLDARVATFEQSFDQRATAGKKVTDNLRKDDRVARLETQLHRVWEQTGNTRSQVKAAVTSARKTVDTVIDAGKHVAS